MATAGKIPEKSSPHKTEFQTASKEQLHRERVHATITVLLLMAAFALVVWLASLAPPPVNYDYQPWMP